MLPVRRLVVGSLLLVPVSIPAQAPMLVSASAGGSVTERFPVSNELQLRLLRGKWSLGVGFGEAYRSPSAEKNVIEEGWEKDARLLFIEPRYALRTSGEAEGSYLFGRASRFSLRTPDQETEPSDDMLAAGVGVSRSLISALSVHLQAGVSLWSHPPKRYTWGGGITSEQPRTRSLGFLLAGGLALTFGRQDDR